MTPLLEPLANFGYGVVAKQRVAINALTRWFVGPDLRRPRHSLVRWLFLRLLALTTLAAVLSWWVQLPGLIGSGGIAPAHDYLERVAAHATNEGWGALETFLKVPTLAWVSASDAALHALCGMTTLGALLLLGNVLPGIGLALAWLGYLSLVAVGGVFMGYQWDALLLESLFVAFFLVPWRSIRPGLERERAPPWVGVWLVRLLFVKLMFLSGIVKLTSNDPTWADLSALDYHYWTQPLPTWTSYWADAAPAWTRDVSIRLMFVIELVLPWLVWSFVRRLRYLAAFGAMLLMVAIGLTGNYGYFNLLTFTIAVMVLDDGVLRAFVPRRWRVKVPDSQDFVQPQRPVRMPVAIAAAALAYLSIASFVVRLDREASPLLRDPLRAVAPFSIANGYGLFATMTTERPEIEVEGSVDGQTWRSYGFAWKPGDPKVAPGFTGPHMPRLDWQMWFAALAGDCRRTDWYLSFAQRLLEGAPDVLALLADNPFPDGPPRYLRSRLWHYSFATPEEREASGDFWVRLPAEQDFCPTVMLVDGTLRVVRTPE